MMLPFFIIVTALLVAQAIVIYQKKTVTTAGRHSGIDGLRGFLAIGVFIHHTIIWRNYCLTGTWSAPSSHFYNQLGQTSVALFFMISGFLFIKKLIDNRETGINWSRFFIGRIARLVPLYYFSLLIIVLTSLALNGWALNTSFGEFIKDVAHWMGFTYLSRPTLNDMFEAQIVNAGVVWSLAFEWLFYFSLPVIGFFVLKVKPHILFVLLGVGFVYLHYWSVGGFYYAQIYSFLGGALVAVLKHYLGGKFTTSHPLFGLLIIACFFGITQYHSADDIYCKLYITAVFGIIAFGNTFFGLLTTSASHLLGTISFSVYLLHGIVLFYALKFIVGVEFIQSLSDVNYLFFILTLVPVVVIVSFLTYTYIELPFINWNKRARYTRKEIIQ